MVGRRTADFSSAPLPQLSGVTVDCPYGTQVRCVNIAKEFAAPERCILPGAEPSINVFVFFDL